MWEGMNYEEWEWDEGSGDTQVSGLPVCDQRSMTEVYLPFFVQCMYSHHNLQKCVPSSFI